MIVKLDGEEKLVDGERRIDLEQDDVDIMSTCPRRPAIGSKSERAEELVLVDGGP